MQTDRLPTITSFANTAAALEPLPRIVYGALEGATIKTRTFFGREKTTHDPFLAPNLMRFFGKRALRDAGIHACEDDGDVSDFESLPNNGLAFFYKRHHVRILKAAIVRGERWKLPGCGGSEPRKDFYNQQLEIYSDAKGNMYTSSLNVIFLWDFDDSFNLFGVHLGCPKAAGIYAKDVQTHWCESLPHPALSPAPAGRPDESSSEMLEELLRNDGDIEEEKKKA